MIFEDERSQLETIRRSLLARYPTADIETESNMYSIFHTISLFRPEILIVDYQFKSQKITDEEKIMSRLFKFKGLVLIYSSHAPKEITREIELKYNILPANFRILSKNDPRRLLKEVQKYYDRRDKGHDSTISSIIQ
jgi:hypothetical protein